MDRRDMGFVTEKGGKREGLCADEMERCSEGRGGRRFERVCRQRRMRKTERH